MDVYLFLKLMNPTVVTLHTKTFLLNTLKQATITVIMAASLYENLHHSSIYREVNVYSKYAESFLFSILETASN